MAGCTLQPGYDHLDDGQLELGLAQIYRDYLGDANIRQLLQAELKIILNIG